MYCHNTTPVITKMTLRLEHNQSYMGVPKCTSCHKAILMVMDFDSVRWMDR